VPAEKAAAIAAAAIADIVLTVSAEQWRRRAAVLDAIRPRPDDFVGSATPEEIAEQDRRLAEAATACRNRAAVIELDEVAR
jgi:hypothetical protein